MTDKDTQIKQIKQIKANLKFLSVVQFVAPAVTLSGAVIVWECLPGVEPELKMLLVLIIGLMGLAQYGLAHFYTIPKLQKRLDELENGSGF